MNEPLTLPTRDSHYPAYAFGGTTMTVVISGEETQGRFSILQVRKPPGSSTPLHYHERDAELPLVLSGTLSVEAEGRINLLEPGDFLFMPAGPRHRLFNASGTLIEEFLLCAPAGFERFVAAAGSPTHAFGDPVPMQPADRDRMAALAPLYGIRIVPSGPPAGPVTRLHSEALDDLSVMGRRVEVLSELDDGGIAVLRVTLHPGDAVPLHSHEDFIAMFVAAGSVEAYGVGQAGCWRALSTGEAVYVAASRRHAVRCRGSRSTTLLIVTSSHLAGVCRSLSGLADEEILNLFIRKPGTRRARECEAHGITLESSEANMPSVSACRREPRYER